MSVQKRVLRGLGKRPMTCSCGRGSGGADESCLAADVGKYMADGGNVQCRAACDAVARERACICR